MRQTIRSTCSALAGALLAFSCAEGGDRKTPSSEVQLSANHHLWNLESLRQLSFPVAPAEVFGSWGTIAFRMDSQYDVTLNGSSDVDDYNLRATGELGILVEPGLNLAKISFLGAYGLEGDTGVFYFTVRYSTSATTSPIGLFWGTRIDAATPDIQGDWHLFSTHVVFSTSQTFNPDNVGRATAGRITIDAAGVIAGTGTESTRASLTFAGSAKTFADSRVDLDTLDYIDNVTTDSRTFLCSAGTPTNVAVPNVILGLNHDTTDGEAGLIALVRARTAGAADPAMLEGTYFVRHADDLRRRHPAGHRRCARHPDLQRHRRVLAASHRRRRRHRAGVLLLGQLRDGGRRNAAADRSRDQRDLDGRGRRRLQDGGVGRQLRRGPGRHQAARAQPDPGAAPGDAVSRTRAHSPSHSK